MLPKGWSRRPLHEVAEVRTGLAKGKTGLLAPVELPYLRVANVQDGFIDITEVKTIAVERRQIERYSLKQGDILMTEGGDFDKLGRGAVWNGSIDPCLHQNHVFSVRVNKELVHPLFLSALSGSEYGRTYFLSCAKRSTNLASINSSQLKQFPVLLPPLIEQNRIANILSIWDQSIAITEQLLANSQRQLKALLQQLIIKPSARGVWTMASIGKVSERIQRRANDDEELPVLMISSRSGFVRQDEKYSRFMAGKSVENYIALDRGEFAYNKGNSKVYEFGCVFPMWSYERGLVPNVYVCFKFNESLHAGFYEHLFRADYLHDQLGALVNTGVRNNGLLNIRPESFLACTVPVPPLEEQQRIATILTVATNWIGQHERDLDLLRQEKSVLMSLLLTGKRRVRLSEAETEAQA